MSEIRNDHALPIIIDHHVRDEISCRKQKIFNKYFDTLGYTILIVGTEKAKIKRQSKPNGTDVDEGGKRNWNKNDDADAPASTDPSETNTRDTADKKEYERQVRELKTKLFPQRVGSVPDMSLWRRAPEKYLRYGGELPYSGNWTNDQLTEEQYQCEVIVRNSVA